MFVTCHYYVLIAYPHFGRNIVHSKKCATSIVRQSDSDESEHSHHLSAQILTAIVLSILLHIPTLIIFNTRAANYVYKGETVTAYRFLTSKYSTFS